MLFKVKKQFIILLCALSLNSENLLASSSAPILDSNEIYASITSRMNDLALNGPIDEYQSLIVTLIQLQEEDGKYVASPQGQFQLCNKTFKYFLRKEEFQRAFTMLMLWKDLAYQLPTAQEELQHYANELSFNFIFLGRLILEMGDINGFIVAEYALDIKARNCDYFYTPDIYIDILEQMIPIYTLSGNYEKALDYAYRVLEVSSDQEVFSSCLLQALKVTQATGNFTDAIECIFEFCPQFQGNARQTAELISTINHIIYTQFESADIQTFKDISTILEPLANRFTAADIDGASVHAALAENLLNVARKNQDRHSILRLYRVMVESMAPFTEDPMLMNACIYALHKCIDYSCILQLVGDATEFAQMLLAKLANRHEPITEQDEHNISSLFSTLIEMQIANDLGSKSLLLLLNLTNHRAFSLPVKLNAMCGALDICYRIGKLEPSRPLLARFYQKITDHSTPISPDDRIFLVGRLVEYLIRSNQLNICAIMIPDLVRCAALQGITLTTEHMIYLQRSFQYACDRLISRL